MSQFKIYTLENAPEGSRETLQAISKEMGFVPNVLGEMAAAPAVLEAYRALSGAFGRTTLSITERMVVIMSASYANGCTYCMAAHTTEAQAAQVDTDVIEALRNGEALEDDRLETLRRFTRKVTENRACLDEKDLAKFLDAGYSRAQALEVVLGVALKTLTNYTNHIAETPLDAQLQPAAWQSPEHDTVEEWAEDKNPAEMVEHM